jgi:hypothetical protein
VSASGFWSYARLDDEAEGGRIERLAHDIVAQYQMITGDMIDLFVDRDGLAWGDAWKDKIDSKVTSAAFFVAVLTPRYFQREECRREFTLFAKTAKELGVEELVLPILYVDIPGYHDDEPTDPLIAQAKAFHHADWTKNRLADRDSSRYRIAVAELAGRLAAANAVAERVVTERAEEEVAAGEDTVQDADDAPGFVELAAQAEATMPQWAESMWAINSEVEGLGAIMRQAAARLTGPEAERGGFVHRRDVIRELAVELVGPVNRIYDLARAFSRQLADVDSGIREIIGRLPAELAGDPSAKPAVVEFIAQVRSLTDNAEVGLGEVGAMIGVVEPVERDSRELRPVLRKLRASLTLMADGLGPMREWRRMIDEMNL